MKILFLGDIVGSSGRKAVKELLPKLIKRYEPLFVIANGENAAGGYGLTERIVEELLSCGIDLLTSGNHIWKKEFFPYLQKTDKVIRPANYGPGAPGQGFSLLSKEEQKIIIINLEGRIFMRPLENPFLVAQKLVEELKKEASSILIDFHAEATSEKMALGYFLNGQVSAVLGTHTHIQTADEKILSGGTAYITDVGMCGAVESVIGMKIEQALDLYISMVGRKLEVEENPPYKVEGVFLELSSEGKALKIERFREIL